MANKNKIKGGHNKMANVNNQSKTGEVVAKDQTKVEVSKVVEVKADQPKAEEIKANEIPKTDDVPQVDEKPKADDKPKTDDKPKVNPKPQAEKPKELTAEEKRQQMIMNDMKLFNEKAFWQNITAMTHTYDSYPVSKLVREYDYGMLDFELAIQRNEVWTIPNKSMLMHSVMVSFPIPEIMIQKDLETGVIKVLDGKQRVLGSIIRFVKNEYSLHSTTPPVGSYPVAGKFFRELHPIIQEAIMNYQVRYCLIADTNEATVSEMFLRLQRSVPLTGFEKSRVKLGAFNDYLAEIASLPLYTKVNISEKQKNSFENHQLIVQCMMILENPKQELSANKTRDFASITSETGVTLAMDEKFRKITEYLGNLDLDEKHQKMIFKKSHLPVLYSLCDVNADPKQFAEKLVKFFDMVNNKEARELPHYKVYREYYEAATKGSTKASNIVTRIRILKEFLGIKDEAMAVKPKDQTSVISNETENKETELTDTPKAV